MSAVACANVLGTASDIIISRTSSSSDIFSSECTLSNKTYLRRLYMKLCDAKRLLLGASEMQYLSLLKKRRERCATCRTRPSCAWMCLLSTAVADYGLCSMNAFCVEDSATAGSRADGQSCARRTSSLWETRYGFEGPLSTIGQQSQKLTRLQEHNFKENRFRIDNIGTPDSRNFLSLTAYSEM